MNLYSWFLIQPLIKHPQDIFGKIMCYKFFLPGEGAGVLPEEDQVKEGQINVILSDSDPLKVFDGIPLKSWFKCDLKLSGIPFRGRHGENHEGRQGRPAAFGQVS